MRLAPVHRVPVHRSPVHRALVHRVRTCGAALLLAVIATPAFAQVTPDSPWSRSCRSGECEIAVEAVDEAGVPLFSLSLAEAGDSHRLDYTLREDRLAPLTVVVTAGESILLSEDCAAPGCTASVVLAADGLAELLSADEVLVAVIAPASGVFRLRLPVDQLEEALEGTVTRVAGGPARVEAWPDSEEACVYAAAPPAKGARPEPQCATAAEPADAPRWGTKAGFAMPSAAQPMFGADLDAYVTNGASAAGNGPAR